MASIQGGQFAPVPFSSLLDPATGRTRVRTVDIRSTRYAIARRYMVRLRRDDFDNPQKLARLALAAGLTAGEFHARFAYIAGHEPPPLVLLPGGGAWVALPHIFEQMYATCDSVRTQCTRISLHSGDV